MQEKLHFNCEGGVRMVTLKDIARQCGVSKATVSKALNGYGDIGKETAEMVRSVAAEMNYLPNPAARQLKTNSSHNIGVLFEDPTMSGLAHEYFSVILNSAKDVVEEMGYDITFISPRIGGSSFVDHCRYRKCDGVLVASADFTRPEVRDLIESEIPTVTIDFTFDNHSSVLSDNVEGNYRLTKYLLDRGHRKIAFIHGEQTSVTKKRLVGFYRALGEYGVEVPEDYIQEARYHDAKACSAAASRLLRLEDPPTAIMFPDDFGYLGGISVFEEFGLRVPDDISVTGYDGINLSRILRPKLVTYYQDAEEIGRLSGKKLVESIERKKSCIPEQILVEGQILEGESVRTIG